MRFLPTLLAASAALAGPILEAVSEKIPGEWIEVLRPDASADAVRSSILSARGTKHKATYSLGSFRGFKLSAADDQIAAIAKLAERAEDAAQSHVGARAALEPRARRRRHIYYDSAGEGTYTYVIDSGIYTAHPDFEGRASFGATFVDGEDESDRNGHGTHVAGTIGSATYGVAKKTELIAVKVLAEDGKGQLSNVIGGLEWAVNDAISKGHNFLFFLFFEEEENPTTTPDLSTFPSIGKSVANLSVGGLRFGNSMNEAAAAAVSAGLFLSVASGNSGWPAILSSGPTTAGSSTCSHPGANVTSTWIDGGVKVLSGTSVAAPHVAGLAAYLLALEGERDPITLCEIIQELGTKDAVKNARSNAIPASNGASLHSLTGH
ncbi:hypothetical protein DL770_009175 [Monosporascus sp. CRB-9-2]|nr:hypothetical protein DL770_009175 [Monosporascus sp. CRB-9-2]